MVDENGPRQPKKYTKLKELALQASTRQPLAPIVSSTLFADPQPLKRGQLCSPTPLEETSLDMKPSKLCMLESLSVPTGEFGPSLTKSNEFTMLKLPRTR